MYIKNATMFIPDNDPDLTPFQTMGDEVKDDHLDRLYTMAGGLIPCDCGCEVAITKPSLRIVATAADAKRWLGEYRAVEFRALCPECYTSVTFVWDASFFSD